jgi:hypothetical protein
MLEEELEERERQREEQARDRCGDWGRSWGICSLRRQLTESDLAQSWVGGTGVLVLLVLWWLLWWKRRQTRTDLELRCGCVRVKVQRETVRNELEDTLEEWGGKGIVSRCRRASIWPRVRIVARSSATTLLTPVVQGPFGRDTAVKTEFKSGPKSWYWSPH